MHGGEINMKEQPNKETYTRRRHIHGGTYILRGYTHGWDIHTEEIYT